MRPALRLVSHEFGSGPGERGAPAKPGNGTHRKPTILVVEDEVLIRVSTAEQLRDNGYRILEAWNADEAKALLQSREPIEVVFSDVNMPGAMNGFELAKWIRQEYPDVAVLLTSGISHLTQSAGYGDEHGPVLQKPYAFDVLLAHIKRLLLP